MKQSSSGVLKFILGWLFITIFVVFFVQARTSYGDNPILRPRQEVIEAFQAQIKVQDSEVPSQAGDPELSKPAQPYNLLNGWLPAATAPIYPTAKVCHDADFQTRLERTGNFRQLTNNYKRGDPDSCSAPIQDMTLAFYQTTPLEPAECIQPFV